MLGEPWTLDTLTSMLEGWALRMLQVLRPSLVGAGMGWEGAGAELGRTCTQLCMAIWGILGLLLFKAKAKQTN